MIACSWRLKDTLFFARDRISVTAFIKDGVFLYACGKQWQVFAIRGNWSDEILTLGGCSRPFWSLPVSADAGFCHSYTDHIAFSSEFGWAPWCVLCSAPAPPSLGFVSDVDRSAPNSHGEGSWWQQEIPCPSPGRRQLLLGIRM